MIRHAWHSCKEGALLLGETAGAMLQYLRWDQRQILCWDDLIGVNVLQDEYRLTWKK